jgi:putative phosphoribosyl transferase
VTGNEHAERGGPRPATRARSRPAHPVQSPDVPVASQVAQALGAPLDVIVVHKLGVPFQPELGMGAVGEDGVRVINSEIMPSRQSVRRL